MIWKAYIHTLFKDMLFRHLFCIVFSVKFYMSLIQVLNYIIVIVKRVNLKHFIVDL